MTTWLVGNECEGWAIFTGGGTHFSDGETPAGWCAIARSLLDVCSVVFGPVITGEVHVAYDGASQHTNNSVELLRYRRIVSFLQFVRACSGRLACVLFL